jgi:hypothetical protein
MGRQGFDESLELLSMLRDVARQQVATRHGTVTGGMNSSQDPSTFGWTRGSGNQTEFDWHGLGTQVAKGTTSLWSGLLDTLNPGIEGGVRDIGGFEDRQNVNNPSMASFHSYGLAMDVNASANPNGTSNAGVTGGPGKIPWALGSSAAPQFGMEWLGTSDPMHFEIHVSPNQISSGVSGGGGSFGGGADWNGPAGVEQWRSVALDALRSAGQSPVWIGDLLRQMNQESSGNPTIQNLTDSNAQRGTPSTGLMQVIWPTFRDTLNAHGYGIYAQPQYLTDPFSNILASIFYTADKFGDLGYWARNGFGPYDDGGWLQPGSTGVNRGNQPEAVLTPAESNAYVTHAQALQDGFNGRLPNITVNNYLDGELFDSRTEVIVDGAMSEVAAQIKRGALST